MLIGVVQGYEELKWGISKLNPLCNGPLVVVGCFCVFLVRSRFVVFIVFILQKFGHFFSYVIFCNHLFRYVLTSF